MKQEVYFIVNSRIGTKKIKELQNAIDLHLKEVNTQIHYTEYGGHAKVLTQKAIKEGIEIVVAVGGDGTVNELIQVLAHSTCKLAIVPTGSGNGLARHIGIPLNIAKAVELIVHHQVKRIDLGQANGVYFISNAGVGFDAMVCNAIKESKFRGLKMYIFEVIKHYFKYKSVTYTIQTNEVNITQNAFFLNVANGREFGYGFQIAPSANLEDGLLDLVLIKKITIINGFGIVWDGFKGNIHNNKHCMHLRAKRIEIKANSIPYFQTDGDAHDCAINKCVLEIQPLSLSVLFPLVNKN